MAKFKVTDPETGKTVTVTGDAPPSQDDAEEIFKNAGLRGSEYGAGVGRAGELASGKFGEAAPELPDPGYVQDQWGNIGAESLKEAGLQMRERQPGAVEDVIRTLPGAILKTGTQFPGLFGDSYAMGGAGAGAATDRQTDYSKTIARYLPTSQGIAETIARPFGGVYEPKTWQGKLLDTALPFSPAAAVKSQLKSLPGRIAQRTARVVAPAALSEGAGELAQGGPLETPARIGGAILGSAAAEGTPALPGALRQAGRAVSDLVPVTRGAQERYAARLARAGATDPANFEQVVRGLQLPQNRLESTRTTAELTGDKGQYELQAKMAGQFPGDAAARRAEQRDAERAHIEKASGTGSPGDLADFTMQTLRDIDRRNAEAARAGLEEAEGRGDAFPQRTPEEYGAPLQGRAVAERIPRAASASAMWQSLDPDRTLIVDAAALGRARDKILDGMGADSLPLKDDVATLVKNAGNMRGAKRFFDVDEYRKDVVKAMSEEKRGSPNFRRLEILNDAIDEVYRTAIESKAAAVPGWEAEFRAIAEATARDSNPDVGALGRAQRDLRQANAGAPGGGAPGDQTPGGTGGQGTLAQGGAPIRGVQAGTRSRDAQVEGRSLLQVIRDEGGIRVTDSNGNITPEGQQVIAAFGGNPPAGVLRYEKGGIDPGDMRRKLQSDRWFGGYDNRQGAQKFEAGTVPGDSANEFYDLLGNSTQKGGFYHPEKAAKAPRNDPAEIEGVLARRGQKVGVPRKDETERLSTWERRIRRAEEAAAKQEALVNDPNMRPFGPENRDQLRAARDEWRDVKETFDEGTVGKITEQKPYGGLAMPESAVPREIFKPGEAGAESLRAYRRAVGDPETLRTIEEYAGSELHRVAVDENGTINKKRADKWLKDHEPAMRQFPELEQRIRAAAASTQRMGEIAAEGRATRARFETDAVQKLLKVDHPDDVSRTIGGMLSSARRGTQLRQITSLARQDTTGNATRGLQRAIGDHIIEKFLKPESSKSVAQNFRAFIRQNESFLGDIVGPETLKSWKQLATRLEEQARALPAARPGRVDDMFLRQLFRYSVSAAVGGLGSGAALGTLASTGLGGLTAAFGVAGVRWLRAHGFKNGDQILSDAVNNPEAMKALLERVPANGPDKGAVGRLFKALGKGALVGGVQGYMSAQQARPDTEGKPVPKSYADTLSQYARPTAP